MCSVDPEGKWRWYLKVEYGVLTIAHYLKLGTSLGGVQSRHSMTGARLRWRGAKRRLARLWGRRRQRASASTTSEAEKHTRPVAGSADVAAFEADLRDAVERSCEEPDTDGTAPEGSAADATSALDCFWEDLLEEEAAAAQGTWDSTATLARWEKKQLLRHYLRLGDLQQSHRRRQNQQQQQHHHREQQQEAKDGEEKQSQTASLPARPLLPSGGPTTSLSSIQAIPVRELERELLTQVLNEVGDYVNITHAEAVDMRLLRLFTKQAIALQVHKDHRMRAQGGTPSSAAQTEEEHDENVFVLSHTDTTYNACKAEGRPTAVTYADAVRLTTLLGEAIAWESFCLQVSRQARLEAAAAGDLNALDGTASTAEGTVRSLPRSQQQKAVAAAAAAVAAMKTGGTNDTTSGTGVKRVGGVPTAVQADCIALMLPNSVEYNLLWCGIARSGPLKSILTDLYEGPAFTRNEADTQRNVFVRAAMRVAQVVAPRKTFPREAGNGERQRGDEDAVAVYRPCRTALINTNLSSNAMLYHALACSGCHAMVLDPQYVPLLFLSNAEGDSGGETPSLRLHVPPMLQRIFLWRWNGTFSAHFTAEMKAMLDRFNNAASEYLPEALTTGVTARTTRSPPSDSHGDATAAPTPTPASTRPPPLDLFDLVKDEYHALSPEAALALARKALGAGEAEGSSSSSGTETVMQTAVLFPAEEERDIKTVPSRFPLLLKRMLTHPPRWLHCDPGYWTTPRGSPTAVATNLTGSRHFRPSTAPPLPLGSPSLEPIASTSPSQSPQPQRFTIAQALFAQLRVRSLRESMALTHHLTELHTAPTEGHERSITVATVAQEQEQSRLAQLDRALAAQQDAFARRMRAVLSRFTPVQPVLFIYTSGTTGLPKAARFSHLRFFATGFLSQTLRYRGKTQEVLERNHAARERFQTALRAAVETAAQETPAAAATPEDRAVPLLSATVDEDTRVRKTNVTSFMETYKSYLVNAITFLLWLLGLLFHMRRLRFVLDRAFHTLTCRQAQWAAKRAREAAMLEEVSRVSVYNCLPMYHTIGCVFCLGQLMHALEEQQEAQADLERQLVWHAVADLGLRIGTHDATALPYVPSRVPTARMVIRTKFSASKFVPDLQHYHITVVQYIGEVLRYAVLYERDHAPPTAAVEALLQQQLAEVWKTTRWGEDAEVPAALARRVLPALNSERDLLHLLNLFARWQVPYAFGNGLRKDIWAEVKSRLSVAQPVEFYSSTEGNIFLFNLFDIPGAVGHIPRFPGPLNWILDMNYFPIFPFRVLRYDEDTQQIWRDPHTRYGKIVQVDEPGEAVGEIIEGYDMFALRRFDGYHQELPADIASLVTARNNNPGSGAPATVINMGDVESKKKVVRHIMWPYRRDAYFRSGDLVKFDDFGFVSFVDRVGETFRWKGENVSTLEVANALSTVHTKRIGVQEAVVYGVTVPGREGRAGMALLTLHRRFLLGAGNDKTSAEAVTNGGEREEGIYTEGPSVPRRPTLHEERLFLQNDLYAFLCGRRRYNGDGTLAQSALPPYATPLFIRVEDAAEETEEHTATDGTTTTTDPHEDDSHALPHNTRNGDTTASAAPERDDAVRTTTFKYRKAILTRQGYAQVPPSTIAHTSAWGECAEDSKNNSNNVDARKVGESSNPPSRFYVLVTKPEVWTQLACTSGSTAAAASDVRAGYVPLTAATMKLVGERLTGCGW